MEINMLIVSKLSSEIVGREVIHIDHLHDPVLSDLTNSIYDKHPALWRSNSYKIYWQRAMNTFAPIEDYLSYVTAVRLMTTNTIYVLVDDLFECWEDNMPFLLMLDHMVELQRIEMERDIYDVRIRETGSSNCARIKKRYAQFTEDVAKGVLSYMSFDSDDKPMRTDEEILAYALRNERKDECYTVDMLQSFKHIHDIITDTAMLVPGVDSSLKQNVPRHGFPKVKAELHPIPDVEFEKRVMKEGKGAKDKKGKNDKKGKKDKGDKKGKKAKQKGGKKK